MTKEILWVKLKYLGIAIAFQPFNWKLDLLWDSINGFDLQVGPFLLSINW